MNDFSEFWEQQMENPMMQKVMEETNKLLGRPNDGCKRLVEMDLSKEERVRIYRILKDRRYEDALNAVWMKVMGENRWTRLTGSWLARKYKRVFSKMK